MATHLRDRDQHAREQRHAGSRRTSSSGGDHLFASASARGPPRLGLTELADDQHRALVAHQAEGTVNESEKNEPKRTVEVRCPKDQCGCSARGKLLATLIDAPTSLFGSGVVLQVACPHKKSRLLRIRL